MPKVIANPTQIRAVRATNLQVGEVLVLGRGETRARVVSVNQRPDGSAAVRLCVEGLTPAQELERVYRDDIVAVAA